MSTLSTISQNHLFSKLNRVTPISESIPNTPSLDSFFWRLDRFLHRLLHSILSGANWPDTGNVAYGQYNVNRKMRARVMFFQGLVGMVLT